MRIEGAVSKVEDFDPTSSRAVVEYLSVLDDAAFGRAAPVEPKAISPTDLAAHYTAAADKPAVYVHSDNYLIDLRHAVIMDVEATTAIRQAEVGAAKTMLDRTAEQFEIAPSRLVADAGYGSAAWNEVHDIEPTADDGVALAKGVDAADRYRPAEECFQHPVFPLDRVGAWEQRSHRLSPENIGVRGGADAIGRVGLSLSEPAEPFDLVLKPGR